MNRTRIISFVLALSTFLLFADTSPAQSVSKQVEPSYEAVLHLIVGSGDDALRNSLPQDLTKVSKHIKNNFNFASYRLADTCVGRIANAGSFEYKSLSDMFGAGGSEPQTFLEWKLGRFIVMPNESGPRSFTAQTFRFGARVPVKTGQTKNSEGQIIDIVNYEAVGLSMDQTSFSENNPTLIGTLSLPKSNGTLFLVLTIKPVEN